MGLEPSFPIELSNPLTWMIARRFSLSLALGGGPGVVKKDGFRTEGDSEKITPCGWSFKNFGGAGRDRTDDLMNAMRGKGVLILNSLPFGLE